MFSLFLSQSPLPFPGKDPCVVVTLLTQSRTWRGQVCYQEKQKGKINEYGCGVLLLSRHTSRQDQNPISICLLETRSSQICQSHILHCLSENPLCTADGGTGKGKGNLICHAGLLFLELGRAWKLLDGQLDRPPPSAETLVTARQARQWVPQLVLTRAAGSDKSGEKWICHIPDLFQFMIEMKDAELWGTL